MALADLKEQLAEDGMLSIKEACAFTKLSADTLYRLMNDGKLPYSQMGPGSRRLIPKKALVKLLADHMVIGEGWEAVNS